MQRRKFWPETKTTCQADDALGNSIPLQQSVRSPESALASINQLELSAKEFDRHATQDDSGHAVEHAKLVARLRSRSMFYAQ